MFSFREAASILGVECQMSNPSILIQGASIDTRKLEAGNLFVAIKTERDDGHRYLENAFLKGASGALIEKDFFEAHQLELKNNSKVFQNLLPVSDPARSLADLASWYRSSQNLKAIAITGSVGKTSTKEFLAYLLRHKAPTLSTEGNLNNHLGLPLTLFRLQPSHRFCVAELGANHAGDIDYLGSMMRPDIAMITQVAPVHLQGFGSLKGIYDAKCELMKALKPGSPIILPEHDNLLVSRAKRFNLNVIKVGYSMQADYKISNVQHDGKWVSFTINNQWNFRFPGLAPFLAKNAGMAIAAGEAAGFPIQEMPSVWDGLQIPKGRFQERLYANQVRVIDDCYNASPVSFRRSLETFAALPPRRKKIVVISDMLELGEEEKKFHEDLGRFVGAQPFDLVVAYGPLSKYAAESVKAVNPSKNHVEYFENLDQAAEFLIHQIHPEDDVLLKASRGMSMDKVLKVIEENFGSPVNRT